MYLYFLIEYRAFLVIKRNKKLTMIVKYLWKAKQLTKLINVLLNFYQAQWHGNKCTCQLSLFSNDFLNLDSRCCNDMHVLKQQQFHSLFFLYNSGQTWQGSKGGICTILSFNHCSAPMLKRCMPPQNALSPHSDSWELTLLLLTPSDRKFPTTQPFHFKWLLRRCY